MSATHLPLPTLPQSTLSRTPLTGQRLLMARALWGAVLVMVLLLHTLALIFLPRTPDSIQQAVAHGLHLTLPNGVIIGYPLIFSTISVLTFIVVGLLIFWTRSDDWVGIATSLTLLTFSTLITPFVSHLATSVPFTAYLLAGMGVLAQVLFLAFLYTFPDGRFVPSWTRWLLVLWFIYQVAAVFFPWGMFNSQGKFTTNYFYVALFFYVTGVFVQSYRRKLVNDPVKRLQTKWVQFGLSLALLSYVSYYPSLFDFTGLSHNVIFMILPPLQNAGLIFVPISIAISMFHFRLWDIDPIINRALVYTGLTGALGALYLAIIVLFQTIFTNITGSQSTLAIAISTLMIASLFSPLRSRLQHFVDRRFYREKVNVQQALTEFTRELRMFIELPDLIRSLTMRTTELLHITYGAVYLRDDEGKFVCREFYTSNELCELDENSPLESVPMELRWLNLSQTISDRLYSGSPAPQSGHRFFPMLVPLLTPVSRSRTEDATVANLRLQGILALGPRLSGQTYSRDDEGLLMALADQAGTGIYVARLIKEREEEARRQEEVEHKLDEYRNSPAGRAEAFAREMSADPSTALVRMHQLAYEAGRDPAAASLLSNVPLALNNMQAATLTSLAKWAQFTFISQYTPELLSVGLRTLIGTLAPTGNTSITDSYPLDGATMTGNISTIDLANSEPISFVGSDEALVVHRFAQAALEINSLPAIVELGVRTWSGGTGRSITDPGVTALATPTFNFLSALQYGLEELRPVVEALRAYERVDTPADKIAYLASALERLRRVDHYARTELGGTDRPILQRITEVWTTVVTSAMLDLQTRAQVSCQLLTRQTWREDVVVLALSVRNTGRGAALNVRVALEPSPEYELLDEIPPVDRLAPGEEAQIGVSLKPNLAEGTDRFRARFLVRYNDPRGSNQTEQFADAVQLLAASGEFQFIPNPYVVGTPLPSGSPLFFGRADAVAGIQENLESGHRNNLVLIGQRRTGKTSLLKQLPARLGEEYVPAFLDGQTLGLDPGLSNFFLNLATEISFAVEDRGFPIDPPDPDMFDKNPATTFEREFLPRVREIIGERHLLILLDEFEELESAVRRGNLDASIFGFLRHMIQHVPNLSVIFCGTHRLEELAADYWNVLFNISLYRHIGFLEREEALRLVQEPVARFGMVYDDLSLDKIWRVTAGHPYFMQLLCHSLVNRHNRTKRSYVTIADVNAALDEIMASGEAHFVYLWSESSYEERLALIALSRMLPQSSAATPAHVVDYLAERGVHIERRAIGSALHRLALRDILSAGSEGDGALGESFRWQLGLLGLWVEKYRSLGRVVDEARAT